LTDSAGDTAKLLRNAGISSIARLDSTQDLVAELPRFMERVKRGEVPKPAGSFVRTASRLERTRELAALLERLPMRRG
jgi:hypothetical protein